MRPIETGVTWVFLPHLCVPLSCAGHTESAKVSVLPGESYILCVHALTQGLAHSLSYDMCWVMKDSYRWGYIKAKAVHRNRMNHLLILKWLLLIFPFQEAVSNYVGFFGILREKGEDFFLSVPVVQVLVLCVHPWCVCTQATVLCGELRTSLWSLCSSSMFVGFWGSVPQACVASSFSHWALNTGS